MNTTETNNTTTNAPEKQNRKKSWFEHGVGYGAVLLTTIGGAILLQIAQGRKKIDDIESVLKSDLSDKEKAEKFFNMR